MLVDPAALDEAVAKHSFTGVATIDVGDFVHRALRVPMLVPLAIAMRESPSRRPATSQTQATS